MHRLYDLVKAYENSDGSWAIGTVRGARFRLAELREEIDKEEKLNPKSKMSAFSLISLASMLSKKTF